MMVYDRRAIEEKKSNSESHSSSINVGWLVALIMIITVLLGLAH